MQRRSPATTRPSRTPTLPPKIDVLVDRTIGAIRDGAPAQTQGALPDDPIHREVESFVKRLFPQGVFAVTSAPFVEDLRLVDEIVSLLHGDLAPAVKELGLGKLAKRLADLAV